MKLSDWAKQQGVAYQTAWKWWKNGKLPVPAEQMPTGTIIVHPQPEAAPQKKDAAAIIYARVSSRDQKDDLTRQVERLKLFASARGLRVIDVIEEIGSGLNGQRKKLTQLLADPAVEVILVEHKDRLTRVGFEYLSAALGAQNRSVLVAEEGEEDLDIWQDFIDLVTSMCARIYGRRGARNRARRAIESVRAEEGQTGTGA